MPEIKAKEIKDKFFKKNDIIPKQIAGLWSLENIGNVSMLMSFSNAKILSNNKVLVSLDKPNSWMFRLNSFATKLISLFKYQYLFEFNEDYTFAQIYIKLGCIPLYFPKFITSWTLRIDPENPNKFIRTTKFLWSTHTYTIDKLIDHEGNVTDKYDDFVKKYDSFYTIN